MLNKLTVNNLNFTGFFISLIVESEIKFHMKDSYFSNIICKDILLRPNLFAFEKIT